MKQERRLSKLHGSRATLTGLAILLFALATPAGSSPQEEAEKPKTPEKSKPPSELSSVETVEERRDGLEKELDSSLAEFDGLILREQEILEKRREESAAAGGSGGAGKAGVAGGGAEGAAEEGAEEAGTSADAGEATGGSPDEPSGEEVAREEGAPVEGGEQEVGEITNGRIPPDVGDGSDDDIVARQLREAAMKEEDPELREKLWDEYRAYKFGEKKKESDT